MTSTDASFGVRLQRAVASYGPLCVGVDPHGHLLTEWGLTDDAAGLATFCDRCVEAFAGRVGLVKPQSAFFERHGSAGIAVLERTVAAFRAAGTPVLLDVKRGDIGSTMAGYAQAYLAPGAPLEADAITVSPFLGFGSLRPALELAEEAGKGVFVLALTSNPEAPELQHAVRTDGTMVAAGILAAVADGNAPARGRGVWGSVGAVVGATVDADTLRAVDLDVGGPLLLPGLGAQGGTPERIAELFGPAATYAIASSSRGLLAAGPDVDALRAAVERTAAELARP